MDENKLFNDKIIHLIENELFMKDNIIKLLETHPNYELYSSTIVRIFETFILQKIVKTL